MTDPNITPYQAPSSETLLRTMKPFRPASPEPPWLLSTAACIVLQIALIYVAPVLSNRLHYPPGIVITGLNGALFLLVSIWSGFRYRRTLAHGLTQWLNLAAWSVDLLTIWFLMGKLSRGDITSMCKTAVVFAILIAIFVQLMGMLFNNHGASQEQEVRTPT